MESGTRCDLSTKVTHENLGSGDTDLLHISLDFDGLSTQSVANPDRYADRNKTYASGIQKIAQWSPVIEKVVKVIDAYLKVYPVWFRSLKGHFCLWISGQTRVADRNWARFSFQVRLLCKYLTSWNVCDFLPPRSGNDFLIELDAFYPWSNIFNTRGKAISVWENERDVFPLQKKLI